MLKNIEAAICKKEVNQRNEQSVRNETHANIVDPNTNIVTSNVGHNVGIDVNNHVVVNDSEEENSNVVTTKLTGLITDLCKPVFPTHWAKAQCQPKPPSTNKKHGKPQYKRSKPAKGEVR